MTKRARGNRWVLAVLIGLTLATTTEAQRKPARPRAPRREIEIVPVIVPVRPALKPGYNARVRVLAGSRLDPTFAASAEVLASTPRNALADYKSTQQHYQLFIPLTYRNTQPHPLIVFVSSSSSPDDFTRFDALCRKYGVLFACPHGAGDDCAPGRRLRIALDTLEDVRQRFNVDTDRIYLAGISTGALIALDIAFSYPEFIGGLLAINGADGLRNEPWLRDRVVERLSVALSCGELSPARIEVERWRFPALRDCEVRTKLWLTPRLAQGLPPASQIEEMFVWLEATRARRRALGATYPPARMAEGTVPAAETWAAGVVEEARKRLLDRKRRESGLMQLEGVLARWKDTRAAEEAGNLLKRHNTWRKLYERRQLEFAYREAKSIDAYLAAGQGLADLKRLPAVLRLAIARWEEVEKLADGQQAREAQKRLAKLRKLVE
jgi:pimeloyl-ACP methyl ester carboxylesterase